MLPITETRTTQPMTFQGGYTPAPLRSDDFAPVDRFVPSSSNSYWAPPSELAFRSFQFGTVAGEAQRDGGHQQTSKEATYANAAEAGDNFRRQSEFLLRPGSWNHNQVGLTYADAPRWTLLNDQGQEEMRNRRLEQGDRMRIDTPGGDYFVQVQNVYNTKDNVGFTVRPCADPNHPGEMADHFFTDAATRTFSLQHDGNHVRFTTEGCNETMNIYNTGWEAPLHAGAGALIMNGGGDLYWSKFADGILNY